MAPLWLLVLGIFAGLLTTVAGMGGGILLVLAISLSADPKTALVATAPALLIGNTHRAFMFRHSVDRRVAAAFVLGALPGSLFGGAMLSLLPDGIVRWAMLGLAALAVARSAGLFSWKPPAAAVAPAGFGIGALAATAGGAGVLAGPLLISAGLSGTAYVATAAVGAVAMHLGRIAAYGAGGLFSRGALAGAAVLTVAILVGNTLGKRARRAIPDSASARIELATLVACVALALAGVR
jgi:uncharacterized protein